MSEGELLQDLVELAQEAGLQVRVIRGAPSGEVEPAAASGVCKVRGETWVVLSGADSVEERIEAVAAALREHAGEWLEQRYLPPSVRERLEGGS